MQTERNTLNRHSKSTESLATFYTLKIANLMRNFRMNAGTKRDGIVAIIATHTHTHTCTQIIAINFPANVFIRTYISKIFAFYPERTLSPVKFH